MQHLYLPVLFEFIEALIRTEDCQVLDWLFASNVIRSALHLMAESDSSVVQEHAIKIIDYLIIATTEKETSFIKEDFVREAFSLAYKTNTEAFFKRLSSFVNKQAHKLNNDDNSPTASLIIEQLPFLKSIINQENRTRQGPYGNITLCGLNVIAMIEYINELVRANIKSVNKAIIELNIIEDCFSLFFRCTMNNFLHTTVVKVVDGILKSNDEDLKLSLFTKTDILNLILNGLNNCNQKDEHGFCHGLYAYSGHLYWMAYFITKLKDEPLVAIIQANDKWIEFERDVFPKVFKNYVATDVWTDVVIGEKVTKPWTASSELW